MKKVWIMVLIVVLAFSGRLQADETTFYSTIEDGLIHSDDASWATAHDRAIGEWYNKTGISFRFGATLWASLYEIRRSYLYFYTADLSDAVPVDSAKLYLYVFAVAATQHDSCHVVQVFSGNAINTDDFKTPDSIGEGRGGSWYSDDYSSPGYYSMNIYTDSLHWINKTGYTKLGLRTALDIDDTAPTGYLWVDVYSTDTTGTSYDPYLTVWYGGFKFQPVADKGNLRRVANKGALTRIFGAE